MYTKSQILKNLCYTELVYKRINKKLKLDLNKSEIEKLVFETIKEVPERNIIKIGKNFYISNQEKGIRATINSFTYRIITVDKI